MAEAFEVVQEVTVDVSKSIPAPTVFCKQADNVVRVLRVTIQDNKEDYPIPAGFAARLRGTKADGTRIYLDARSAAGNVAEFILTQNALAAYGKATCEVELSNSAGDVVKSCNLVLNVQKTAMDDSAVESTDEFQSLGAAVAGAQAAQKAAAKSAEAAKKSADDAKAVQDSLPADYTKMSSDVDTLNTKMELAYPDNTAPTDATWSARKTLDTLCREVKASGNPVVLEDVCEIEPVISWDVAQEGTGDPSPDNIRPIKGRDRVSIHLFQDNLLAPIEPNTYITQGVTVTYNEDGTTTLNGTATADFVVDFTKRTKIPTGTYSLSLKTTGTIRQPGNEQDMPYISVSNSMLVFGPNTDVAYPYNGTITNIFDAERYELAYGYMRCPGGVIFDNVTVAFTLQIGSTSSNSYLPYKGQTNILTLPETMAAAMVDARTGEGIETWRLLTFDGTEDWSRISGGTNLMLKDCAPNSIDGAGGVKCSVANGAYDYQGDGVYLTSQCVMFGILFGAKWETVDAFKQFLADKYAAGTPVQVAYKLATPKAFTATGGVAFAPLDGKNTVLTDADTMEVTAKIAPKTVNDSTVGSDTWSSKNIVDMLCPPIEETGNPVQCYPVPGYPLGCKVSWELVQEGTGDPSPTNIRPIVGRNSVILKRCGENLLDTVAGYVNASVKSERCTYTVQNNVITIRAANTDAYLGEVGVKPGNKYNPTSGPIFVVSEDTSLYLLLSNTSVNKNYITFYDSDLVTIGNYRTILTNSASFIVPKGAAYASLRIGVRDSVGGESYSTTISVTVGTTAPSTYTPYTGQTTTLTLPETLCDCEVDAVTGDGYSNWRLLMLEGTEDIDYTEGKYFVFPNVVKHAVGLMVLAGDRWKGKATASSEAFYIENDYIVVGVDTCGYSNIDRFKEYLVAQKAAGTPVQLFWWDPRAISAAGSQPILAISGVNTILTNADTATVTGRADPIKRITDLEDAVASMTT